MTIFKSKKIFKTERIFIIALIFCAIVAFFIIFNTVIIPNNKIKKLKSAQVGDYIFFGTYEQDNKTSNGKENIEWLVLDKKDGKSLLISKYALDCKPYNTSSEDVTWESCTIRKWLNDTFLNSAFTTTEKSMISTVTVSADKNTTYHTNPGNSTKDKICLLSTAEVKKYFTSNKARRCEPTEYTVSQGVNANNDNYCWWWLRTPGRRLDRASGVSTGGQIAERGIGVGSDNYAIRPALWIESE